MTGFWGCIEIFVVGFGGADKWAFNIGEAGVVINSFLDELS